MFASLSSLFLFYKICISKATATFEAQDNDIKLFYKICISKATAT